MSNARVTQQYVEILAQNPSKARITQQYVEILSANASSTNYEESVNSSLGLTDSYTFEYATSLSDSLGISDSNSVSVSRELSESLNLSEAVSYAFTTSLTDTLNVTHEVEKHIPFNYHIVHETLLDSIASEQKDRSYSASSTIDLDDSLTVSYHFDLDSTLNVTDYLLAERAVPDSYLMGDTMAITDLATFDLGNRRFPEDTLGITDNVVVSYPYKTSVGHYIRIDSDAFVQHAVQNYSIETDLDLRSGTPIEPSFTDDLGLTDEAVRRWWPITDLGLTETVIAAKAKNAENDLDLVQTINTIFTFNRSFESEIENLHAVTYYLPNKSCVLRNYSPFIGDTQKDFRKTIKPTQRDATTNRVVLAWPTLEEPLKQVILRAPEIDDITRYTQTRSYKETRGGSISVYSDPIWPKIQSLVVTFIGLSATEADEFQDFVYDTLGKEIDLGDWNGYIWKGLITNPDEPLIEDSKRGFTISFQFDGNLRSDDYAGQSVSLSGSTDYEITKWFRDTINFEESVSYNVEWAASARSYALLSDYQDREIDLDANTSIEPVEDVEVLRVRLVEDTINLTDNLEYILDFNRVIEETSNITDTLDENLEYPQEIDETLNVTDTVATLDKREPITDTMNVYDLVDLPLYPVVEDNVELEDEPILTVNQVPT